MTGAARQNALWAQSLSLSVLLHGAFVLYVAGPLLHFNALQLPPADPVAVTLSITEASPESLEPTVPEPVEEPLPVPQVIPPEQAEELAPVIDDAADVAAAEPEMLSALSAEEIAPIAPIQTMEPEVISPVAAEISPLLPDEDTLAALAPLGNAEVIGATDTITVPVTPQPDPVTDIASASASEVIAPVAGLPTSDPDNAPAPVQPAATPEGTPGTPGQVDEFILRIRGQLALPCLVATPRRNPDGAVTLEMLAANEADILTFAGDLLAGVAPVPDRKPVLVDARQCAALNFVREGARYPAYPLALGLESDDLVSGERLKGSLRNAAGRYVTLVLIDDNGVVQDLGAYLSFSGDTVSFDVPVRRDGPSRDTQQLLLAIATPGRPTELDAMNGQLAQDFFAALRRSVPRDAPLAMMPFTLE